MTYPEIIQYTTQHPKQLFLLDGIGALVTAICLGFLLVKFESLFGMPKQVLYYLAAVACIFACYSLFCSFRLPQNWKPFLKIIAIANLIYCLTTAILVFQFQQELTMLGKLYFMGEIAIILFLVSIELKTVYGVGDKV